MHERVQPLECLLAWKETPEVECSTCGCRHRHACDTGDLVVRDALVPDDDATRRPDVVPDEFNGDIVVHPLRAVQRRGRDSGHNAVPLCPHPGCGDVVPQRQRLPLGHMHVPKDRPIPALQFMSCDDTTGNRLGADQYLPHGQMLALGSDKPAEMAFRQEKCE